MKIEWLYQILGTRAGQNREHSPPAPSLVRIRQIDVRRENELLQFYTLLNAMLAYMPLPKEEAGLRGRFVKIGIVPDAPFEPPDEETCSALIEGMRQGLMAMYACAQTVKSSGELFGSREQ